MEPHGRPRVTRVPDDLGPSVMTLGPAALGLRATEPRAVDGAVWWAVDVPRHLDGPPGVLQGGLVAGLLHALVRSVDPFGAPLHHLELRLDAPTPLGRRVHVRSAPISAGVHEVELIADGLRVVRAEVDLTGADPIAAASDLRALADAPLPDPMPSPRYPTCVVCGPFSPHPVAIRAFPGWVTDDAVMLGWIPDPVLADPGDPDRIDTAAVAAVLSCATAWAAMRPVADRGAAAVLMASLRFRSAAPVEPLDPVRVVARLDTLEDRRARARSAVVDTDGRVLALADALHVAVDELPVPSAGARSR